MKKMRKLAGVLLMAAMVAVASVPVMATENITPQTETPSSKNATVPSQSDEVTLTIKEITGAPTVTLYQIASGTYGEGGKEFIGFDWVEGTKFADVYAPTAAEIAKIANGIIDQTISPKETIINGSLSNGTYIYSAKAGVYVAVLTGAEDGSVYNPILLSASYEEGMIYGGTVSVGENYLYGTNAVAKKSTPDIDKEITDGATTDSNSSEASVNTASVGDVLTYKLTLTMPSYPSEAANKTFFISDTMPAGLTFDFSSLTVEISGQTVIKEDNTFKLGENIIATAASTSNGFNLVFNYDKLISNEETGTVYIPTITYKAVVNENAVAGNPGNTNTVTLYYANEPNTGSTHTGTEKPTDNTDGITTKTDSETIYTYQLAFLKTGEDADNDGTADPLADAVFGIYAESSCTTLIDVVKTNENGYAVSTNVAAGTYYIKEIAAPTGYSLNTEVYNITANWTSATTTATSTDRTWTTTVPQTDAKQIGWVKDGVFYAMSEFIGTENGVSAAYLKTETTTEFAATATGNAGSGTVLRETSIPNTKLAALPSTGGIGTYLFTIIGVAVMAAMALLFLRGRKEEK